MGTLIAKVNFEGWSSRQRDGEEAQDVTERGRERNNKTHDRQKEESEGKERERKTAEARMKKMKHSFRQATRRGFWNEKRNFHSISFCRLPSSLSQVRRPVIG